MVQVMAVPGLLGLLLQPLVLQPVLELLLLVLWLLQAIELWLELLQQPLELLLLQLWLMQPVKQRCLLPSASGPSATWCCS